MASRRSHLHATHTTGVNRGAVGAASSSAGHHERTDGEEFSPRFERRASFVDGYAPFSGARTVCLRPSSDKSNFASHSFSRNGDLLVTGETNGTIRVWRTTDYRLEFEACDVFAGRIDSVNFVDGRGDVLIAVDVGGNLIEFAYKNVDCGAGTSSSPNETPRRGQTQILRKMSVAAVADSGRVLEASTRQFSEDGRTLVCSSFEDKQPVHVYRFKENYYEHTVLGKDHPDDPECAFPILAKNGRSLLMCFLSRRPVPAGQGEGHQDRFSVQVWPHLRFTRGAERQWTGFATDRATWGADGKFLLVWNVVQDQPRLSIYETAAIRSTREFVSGDQAGLLASKDLGFGLVDWKAKILHGCQKQGTRVLVYLKDLKGRSRFLVWDIAEDCITKEVIVAMPKPPSSRREAETKQTLFGHAPSDVVEQGALNKKPMQYFCLIMEDLFPKFSASRDGKWVGVFSWQCCGGAVASLESEVAYWNFTLDEWMHPNPYVMWNEVHFDDTGRHFVLFGDRVIFAAALPFLSLEDTQRTVLRSSPFQLLDRGNPEMPKLVKVFRRVSTGALTQAISRRAWDGTRHIQFPFEMSQLRHESIQSIRDAAISDDGKRLAFIACMEKSRAVVFTVDLRPQIDFDLAAVDKPPAKRFAVDDENFLPGRVFLYKDKSKSRNKGIDSMIVFKSGYQPAAMFCDLVTQGSKIVPYPMERCYRVSQTQDRSKLLLLDVQSVCIVDVRSKLMTYRVSYETKLGQLLERVTREDDMRWCHRPDKHQQNADLQRHVSDDGRAVLLSWDIKNRRSIVVTPDTAQSEVQKRIGAAQRGHSDFCALSRDARTTLFIDTDAISENRIEVGVFSEETQQVLHVVCVVGHVRMHLARHTEIEAVLANVFYDLSRDGKELMVVTVHPDQEDGAPRLVDGVARFNVYQSEGCLPDYARLASDKGLSKHVAIQRTCNRLGAAALNAPVSNGRSILHEAFFAMDTEMLENVKRHASLRAVQLTPEWIPPGNTKFTNLLERAVELQSSHDIRLSLRLICSPHVPFNRSASILKNNFQSVLKFNADVLEEALFQNVIIAEACVMPVCPEALDPFVKSNKGFHVDTSNSFLQWKLFAHDAEHLGEQWKEQNQETVQYLKRHGSGSRQEASLQFVCVEDAAKVGMSGILRPLLLCQAPAKLFTADAVKWTILYKWFKVWRVRIIWKLVEQTLFLAMYALYTTSFTAVPALCRKAFVKQVQVTSALMAAWLLRMRCFIEEIRQMKRLLHEQKHFCGSGSGGLFSYALEMQNCIHLCSSVLICIVIPVMHFCVLFTDSLEKYLTLCVAAGAILATAKVWYLARPFRATGAMVLMVDNFSLDFFRFFAMASMVLLAFACGMHIFQETLLGDSSENVVMHFMAATLQQRSDAFFCALIGAFDQEWFLVDERVPWKVSGLFALFIVVQVVMVANFFFALAGNTFYSVRKADISQLLKRKAMAIDACEAALTDKECEEIDKTIGKYVHALVDVKRNQGRNDETNSQTYFGTEGFLREVISVMFGQGSPGYAGVTYARLNGDGNGSSGEQSAPRIDVRVHELYAAGADGELERRPSLEQRLQELLQTMRGHDSGDQPGRAGNTQGG